MARKTTSRTNPTPAGGESIRHNDKRKNIPTEELRDFVADDEKHPKTMFYPRDPSLDPQLVWKGISMEGSGLTVAASKHHNLSEESTSDCSATSKFC